MDEPRRASADARDEAQRGREAALLLLDAEEHPGPIEGFSQVFADAALDEIEHLQKTRFRGVVKRLLEGAVDASMSLPCRASWTIRKRAAKGKPPVTGPRYSFSRMQPRIAASSLSLSVPPLVTTTTEFSTAFAPQRSFNAADAATAAKSAA